MLFILNMLLDDLVVPSYGFSNFSDFIFYAVDSGPHILGGSIEDFQWIRRVLNLLIARIHTRHRNLLILLLIFILSDFFLLIEMNAFLCLFALASLLTIVMGGDLALTALFLNIMMVYMNMSLCIHFRIDWFTSFVVPRFETIEVCGVGKDFSFIYFVFFVLWLIYFRILGFWRIIILVGVDHQVSRDFNSKAENTISSSDICLGAWICEHIRIGVISRSRKSIQA